MGLYACRRHAVSVIECDTFIVRRVGHLLCAPKHFEKVSGEMVRAFSGVRTRQQCIHSLLQPRGTGFAPLKAVRRHGKAPAGVVSDKLHSTRGLVARAVASQAGVESWWKVGSEFWEEASTEDDFWEIVNDSSAKVVVVGAQCCSVLASSIQACQMLAL